MQDCMVIAALRNLWPKEGHIIFPGEWAYRYRDLSDIKELDAEIDTRPNVTAEDNWKNKYRCTSYYYNRMMEATTAILNTYHGVNESKAYWEFILGKWMCTFTRTYFSIYWRLTEALKRHPNVYITACTTQTLEGQDGNIINRIIGMDKTIYRCEEDPLIKTHFKKYIQCSQVIAGLAKYYNFTLKEDESTYEFKKISLNRETEEQTNASIGKIWFRNLLYRWVFVRGKFFENYGVKDFIKYRGRYIPGYPDYINSYLSNAHYSNIERDKLKPFLEHADEFETILLSVLTRELPIFVVEDYENIITCAHRNAHRPPKFVNLSLLSEGPQMVLLGEWKKRGTKFARVAHSLSEGMMKEVDSREKGVDYYYIWQKGLDCGKYRGMPSFKSHMKITQDENCKDILWCSSDEAVDSYFSEGTLVRWSKPKEYMPVWIDHLNSDLKHHLLYRDRDSGGWGIADYYMDRYEWLRVDNQLQPGTDESMWVTFVERCQKSRMVICEICFTGVVGETLSMNKPLIIIDPEAYDRKAYYQEGVYEILAEMEQIGILYTNPVAAANFINEQYEAIEVWWNDEMRQDFVQRFSDLFMYSQEDQKAWLSNEIREIRRICH